MTGLAAKLLASVLFLLSAAGLAVAVQTDEGILSALFGVYLTGLLVVGVFRDLVDAKNWQVAFFGGVAIWGGYEYLVGGDRFSLLLAVLGVVMVVANLLDIR